MEAEEVERMEMTTPTHVFILTAGEYSDYRIVGVFSTPERAAKHAKGVERGEWWHDICKVEVHPLDPQVLPVPASASLYTVKMLRNGDTTNVKRWNNRPTGCDSEELNEVCLEHRMDRSVSPTVLKVTRWARDRAHVVKIANDLRIQLVASGAWPEEWK